MTLCAAHSLATLCLSTTSGPDLGELPGFWGSMVSRHAPIPRKGSSNQQQQQQQQQQALWRHLASANYGCNDLIERVLSGFLVTKSRI